MKKILYLILLLPLFSHAQIGLTDPKGGVISLRPNITVTNNGVETTIFQDSIPANRLIPFVDYPVTVRGQVTTGALNLSTITFKVYYGASTPATVLSGGGILSSTTGSIFLDMRMLANTMSQQILYASLNNSTPSLLTLTNGNTSSRSTLTGDASQKQLFKVTCTISGVSTASYTTDWIKRPSY